MVEVIAIGGSAGSLSAVINIVNAIPRNFNFTVIIVLHRLRNVYSEMDKILAFSRPHLHICEPNDKEQIKRQVVYLAPQNYHLLIEEDKTFGLDYSEEIHYSRPSIDVTFESIASVYKENAVAILLSGANQDGADGLSRIIAKGGIGIAQDPATAEYPTMPQAAVDKDEYVLIQTVEDIVDYISTVNQ